MRFSITIISAAFLVASCGGNSDQAIGDAVDPAQDAPAVTFTPAESGTAVAGKPTGPVTIGYRIVGEPVVGQPVAIEIQLTSTQDNQPIDLSYRINDATALRLAESQPLKVSVAPSADKVSPTQQVTIVPLREGRLYLNVAADVQTVNGSVSTVTAVPIQVGEGGRDIVENGSLETDENGETVRSLPAQE